MEIHRWQQIIVHQTDGKKNSYENFEKGTHIEPLWTSIETK